MDPTANRITASHGKPLRHASRARGACVRVGTGGAAAGTGGGFAAFWLTLAEAKELRAELDAAIRTAEGLAISGLALARPEAA